MAQVTFDYALIEDAAVRRRAQQQAAEIRKLLHRTAEAVVDIGRRLEELRQVLTPGDFRAWLKAEFVWTQSVGWNYLRAAAVFGDVGELLRQFQPSAVVMLSRHAVPEPAIKAALALARRGETITYRKARALLVEHGAQPTRKDAGTGRTVNAQGEKFLTAGNVDTLRETLDRFAGQIGELTGRLSREDREALADKFLRLALQLREQPDAAAVPTPADAPSPAVAPPQARQTKRRGRELARV